MMRQFFVFIRFREGNHRVCRRVYVNLFHARLHAKYFDFFLPIEFVSIKMMHFTQKQTHTRTHTIIRFQCNELLVCESCSESILTTEITLFPMHVQSSTNSNDTNKK